MRNDILKNKKWNDLKTWQKFVFVLSACLFIFGLIYLPIEYKNKVGDYEVTNAFESGCDLFFDNYNLTKVLCDDDFNLKILNNTGKFNKNYIVDDFILDYTNYLEQKKEKVFDFELGTTANNT